MIIKSTILSRFVFLTLVVVLFCACSGRFPTVVDLPRYDYRNVTTIEIEKIVRTDTATVFTIKAFFESFPWITISPNTHLFSNGVNYKLLFADGITPGERINRTPDGETSFKLFFEPLPPKLKEVSFLEGEQSGDFQIFHIDLTGKKPADKKKLSAMPAHLPAPSTDSGLTTVNVDMGCDLKGLPPVTISILNDPLIPPRKKGNFVVDAKFDDSGKATMQFYQNGVYGSFFSFDGVHYECGDTFYTTPGETVKITIDLSYRWLTERRFGLRSDKEAWPFYPRFEGDYAALLDYQDYLSDPDGYNMIFDPRMANNIPDAEGYVNFLSGLYQEYLDSVSFDNTLPDFVREYLQIKLKGQAVLAMTEADMVRRSAYYITTGSIPSGLAPLELQDADYAWLGTIGLNDPNIFLSDYSHSFLKPVVLNVVAPVGDGFIGALATLGPLSSRAQAGETLTREELSLFDKCEFPMFKKCLERIATEAKEAKAIEESLLDPTDKVQGNSAKGKIRSVPETAAEKMLDAILDRYKGKAVLVDFWATWCAPCKAAMQTMEPMKESRFKDVAFVYITSSTSPKEEWVNMVPKIIGDHYYLTDNQLKVIYSQIKTNAFPSYIIVRKDGSRSNTYIGYEEEMLETLDNAL